MSTAIVWFRRDLRISDNPALTQAAVEHDRVVPLFVLDNALLKPAGDNRLAFLLGCLTDLNRQIGGRLVLRTGPPVTEVRDLVRQVGAAAVYGAEDFGPYGRHRDENVERTLAQDGIELILAGSPYAVPPGTIFNHAGDPYKVFTPFSKAWRSHGWDDPISEPASIAWASGVDSDEIPAPPLTGSQLPDTGEAAAQRRLDQFLSVDGQGYADHRNDPGRDATSRLSPYVKWGCIHPRQILHRLGHTKGESTFATELCWRDFYADVLFHRPDSARQPYNRSMAGMQVDHGQAADERFRAWSKGETGYPIVDAGMRQLLAEGWMHNRVRMIVASFLVKDLHLDWNRGASWFMQHLVDGDLASNQHGWQWVAGTGTDAAPYFRVFNPVAQSQKFDPDGAYIRRYVPELRGVAPNVIHAPWTVEKDLLSEEAPAPGYPEPIVDHSIERQEALARYARMAGG